ncbi:YbaB/EbfC family nucleoid-associated protein [Phytomonospora endophytica]|uniref:DNA-binding protein YbaB n=1 Tax=Phytomonospora endophytica TaxID=714109 RepID=A0A841FGT7_9ACTN|nr:YbaB/EbfC family nucleoid-associated protein [Phytomonospora endophytica]MBB6036531.1 DNA-binding protein YbaB [Phytomonospora endophytica]GIG65853.1 hypothetical protein Pen01_21480 [Phytomonospora endophytica]
MSRLKDLLDRMVVTVRSPDNMIKARLYEQKRLQVAFRPGAYERYRADRLEHQLSRLGTLMWTGYRRGYYAALGEVTGRAHDPSPRRATWDPNRRRFQEEQATTPFEGASPSGLVRVTNVGMMDWRVTVEPEALKLRDEHGFADELAAAGRSLLADYRVKTVVMKDEHYRLAIPDWMRLPKGTFREGRD